MHLCPFIHLESLLTSSGCRWCAFGYCEDCLDWDRTRLLGDNIDEYKVLKFPIRREAYYVICQDCNVPGITDALDEQAEVWQKEAAEMGVIGDEEELKETESELDASIMDTVEEIMDALPTGGISTPKKKTKKSMNAATTSPTPGLAHTPRPTAEPMTPTTPMGGVFDDAFMDAASPTLAKRKQKKVDDEGSAKKQKRNYYEIEV